jgi:5'-deoxynucleotidase YfbR-like HD superfamily hydrolase
MSYDHLTMLNGRQVSVDKICAADIRMDEISHSLSLINRYNGHTIHPYSVAQHTLNVVTAMEASTEILRLSSRDRAGALFAAILHDAAEAYIGDITRPIKQTAPGYKEAELKFEALIFKRYGLPTEYLDHVWEFDDSITANEMRYLFPELPAGSNTFKPLVLKKTEEDQFFAEKGWWRVREMFRDRASLAWGDWIEANR